MPVATSIDQFLGVLGGFFFRENTSGLANASYLYCGEVLTLPLTPD
jgi:hypothetical protein